MIEETNERYEQLSQLTLHLLEELSSMPMVQPQVVYQQPIPGMMPPPPPVPVTGEQPRHVAKRSYNAGLIKMKLLLETKERLIEWKLVEKDLQPQIEKEIQELKEKISKQEQPNGE